MDQINEYLYIADMDDVESEDFKENYSHITHVNLAKKYLGYEDLYYPLPDCEMEQRRFNGAVYNVAERLKRGEVVVNCWVGISRSVSVSATALAYLNGTNFVQEFQKIKDVRSQVNPKPELRKHAREFLGENFDRR